MTDALLTATDVLQTALVASAIGGPVLVAFVLAVNRFCDALGPTHPRDDWR